MTGKINPVMYQRSSNSNKNDPAVNLYLRLLLVLLKNMTVSPRHHSHACESRFRVLPHDLDAFGHMNNGRYLQIMDVARAEWMMQTGVASAIRQNRWGPVLGGGFTRFRHSMKLWQSYSVLTRLLGWDNHWFYLEHCFLDKQQRYVAVGVTRAGLRKKGAWVPAQKVANIVAPGATSPLIPDHVLEWLELEQRMYQHGKEHWQQHIEIKNYKKAG
ncbi:MAG: thioesterase family protein [Gammaproteobacteria bacterium]